PAVSGLDQEPLRGLRAIERRRGRQQDKVSPGGGRGQDGEQEHGPRSRPNHDARALEIGFGSSNGPRIGFVSSSGTSAERSCAACPSCHWLRFFTPSSATRSYPSYHWVRFVAADGSLSP